MSLKLVGLGKHAYAGKDTVYRYISEMVPGAKRFAFADALKEEVALEHGTSVGYINSYKEDFRELLQSWGQFRRQENPLYWIEQVAIKIQIAQPRMAVITDCRYRNESEWVRCHGSGIYVVVDRPGYEGINSHQSEHDLDDVCPDYVIANAGDLPALRCRVSEFLEWYDDFTPVSM